MSRWPLVAVALLLAANGIVPLVFGDVYPFTSAPMFRDAPRACCNYRVFGPDGQELSPEDWLVQRIYDGNPVGYGVGVRPPAVIEQEFGVVHDEAAVRQHIAQQLRTEKHRDLAYVEVEQQVIGPLGRRVGVTSTRRWRVER
jgi:hypothetical protein